jgi:sigma-70-like protein
MADYSCVTQIVPEVGLGRDRCNECACPAPDCDCETVADARGIAGLEPQGLLLHPIFETIPRDCRRALVPTPGDPRDTARASCEQKPPGCECRLLGLLTRRTGSCELLADWPVRSSLGRCWGSGVIPGGAPALAWLRGRPYEELAAELECSEQVVRQHVSRGLRRLRAGCRVRYNS